MSEVKPPIFWIKSPTGTAEYYANMSHVMWSLDDVRVRLGQLIEAQDSDPTRPFIPVAQERAAVTMSWRNAKLLAKQLAALVESYENVNGEITLDVKLPPAVF